MTHAFAKRLRNSFYSTQRSTSVFLAPKPACYSSSNFQSFLTPQSDPRNHTVNDIGLFYVLNNSLFFNTLCNVPSLQVNFKEECKTFKKTYVMVRKPGLEIINYLKHTNYEHPINKYVLYGKYGHGVSMTMLYVMHYAYVSDWLIVNVPDIESWLLSNNEIVESTTRKGLLDVPALGSAWLSDFKNQNLKVITKLDLRLNNNYTWNIQEENCKGESLLGLLDHGIARGKYSCDVIIGLLEEIKLFSKSGLVKTLVLIDDFSVIYRHGKKLPSKKVKLIPANQLSFMDSFMNMAKTDWHNGAAVLSCHSEKDLISDTDHLPLNKLTLKGFEFLDPFVPIEVPRLTDVEMQNLLDLYRSERWLLRSDIDDEIKALSSGSIRSLKKKQHKIYLNKHFLLFMTLIFKFFKHINEFKSAFFQIK